jgi:hypothetical protein
METLSKGLFGRCPICGSNWSEKTGMEVGVEGWTYHKNDRLLEIIRNGAKYYKCPDCNSVWEPETERQLSGDEIKRLGIG